MLSVAISLVSIASFPSYSFIEPRYYDEFGNQETDMHPPSVVTLGEQLIADVYNCIRASKLWPKTMLIITFDEHGGCYDHVAHFGCQSKRGESRDAPQSRSARLSVQASGSDGSSTTGDTK